MNWEEPGGGQEEPGEEGQEQLKVVYYFLSGTNAQTAVSIIFQSIMHKFDVQPGQEVVVVQATKNNIEELKSWQMGSNSAVHSQNEKHARCCHQLANSCPHQDKTYRLPLILPLLTCVFSLLLSLRLFSQLLFSQLLLVLVSLLLMMMMPMILLSLLLFPLLP